jgi:NAD(P)-dependent dehydrogenase (short-subunit alcohol dehydrogenase family)
MPSVKVSLTSVLVLVIALLAASPKWSSLQPLPASSFNSLSSYSKKSVVITGGTSGVGYEAAKAFANAGANVVITGRNYAKVSGVAEGLPGDGVHVGMKLDLTDPLSSTSFSGALLDRCHDLIILNAGMVYNPSYTGPYKTKLPGGYVDTMIASNHMGHHLVTRILLDKIVECGTRVVFVSSISHHLATGAALAGDNDGPMADMFVDGAVDGQALAGSKGLDMMTLYGTSKLLNVLTARKLAKLIPETSEAKVVVTTPGFTITDIAEVPGLVKGLAFSAEEGGEMLVKASLLKDDVKGTVEYGMLQPYWIWSNANIILGNTFMKGALHNFIQEVFFQKINRGDYVADFNSVAYDDEIVDRVWEWSGRMVGL